MNHQPHRGAFFLISAQLTGFLTSLIWLAQQGSHHAMLVLALGVSLWIGAIALILERQAQRPAPELGS